MGKEWFDSTHKSMKTLSEFINGDPKKLEELLKVNPTIGDSIIIGTFSCTFIDSLGETIKLTKHWFMFTRYFHLNMESQAECFVIDKYKAEKIIRLRVHKK